MRKLIRDKLDKVIPADRLDKCKDIDEYFRYLLAKLDEELIELEMSEYKDIGEYVDVIEVLFAIAKFNGIREDAIMNERIVKFEQRGGFDKQLLLKDEHED